MKLIFKRRLLILFVLIIGSSCFFLVSSKIFAAQDILAKNGKISFSTTSTKATSGTRYKTVGFTITREPRCLGSQCAPQLEEPFGEVRVEQVNEVDNQDGTLTTFFKVPEDKVSAALKDAGLLDITYGGTIYLSSIFHVIHGVNEDPHDYTDLQSIKTAESWADPNGFRQYYDIPVNYTAKFKVDYILKTTSQQLKTGQIVNPEHDPNDEPEEVGLWKVGESIVSKDFDLLPEEYTGNDGITYRIFKSYIQSKIDESRMDYVVEGDPDTKPTVYLRNFSTYVGGTHLVGVYKPINRVRAKFFSKDGMQLQEPEDLGNKETGEEVTYNFPPTLTKNGLTYTITQSYLVYNSAADDKKFIQNEGSAALLTRNFTTPEGGANIIGIYKSEQCETDPDAPGCSDEGGEPSGSGYCTWIIQPPNQAAASVSTFMDPNARGVIYGDDPTNGRHFDSPTAIPSSENLYANAWGMNYLYQHTFANMKGQVLYSCKVDVTYQLKWLEKQPDVTGPDGTQQPQPDKQITDTEDKTYTFTLTPREYAYWQINNLEVYQINRATMSNYSLPGGTVTLNPNGYTPPVLRLKNSDAVTEHVMPKDTGKIMFTPPVVDQPSYIKPSPPDDTELLKSMAETQTKDPDVKNDLVAFTFKGQMTTVMDDKVVTKIGPTPGSIPPPTSIGDYKTTGSTILYRDHIMITPTLANRANTPSDGTMYYDLLPEHVGGNDSIDYPITNINNVTVHTPVVNYALLPDDNRPFDQRMEPDMTRTVLVLDRPFTIHIPESGQHANYPGYGDRDYIKYTKKKRVMFPFGVFNGSGNTYYPENTWISIPVGTSSMTFKMPTWVNEANYQIRTEEWAINSVDTDPCELNKNGNLNNYCAAQTFNVGVVGRLFNFRVWDIGDLRFESVFRTAQGSKNHTANAYYSGGRDENGVPTALDGQYSWLLPVRPGSHPTQRATVPHNGYSFLFDFKTMGNLWQQGEGVRIDPTFWFVPRSGGTPSPVDLYYDARGSGNKMIGVGSPADKKTYTRYYQLADPFRNIAGTELQSAAAL